MWKFPLPYPFSLLNKLRDDWQWLSSPNFSFVWCLLVVFLVSLAVLLLCYCCKFQFRCCRFKFNIKSVFYISSIITAVVGIVLFRSLSVDQKGSFELQMPPSVQEKLTIQHVRVECDLTKKEVTVIHKQDKKHSGISKTINLDSKDTYEEFENILKDINQEPNNQYSVTIVNCTTAQIFSDIEKRIKNVFREQLYSGSVDIIYDITPSEEH
jgi:hypothetical protein